MQAFLRAIDQAFAESGDLDCSEELVKLVNTINKVRHTVDGAIGVLLVQQVSKCMTDMHAAVTSGNKKLKKKNKELVDSSDDEEDVVVLMDDCEGEAAAGVSTGVQKCLQGQLPTHDMPPDMALLRAAVLHPGKRAVKAASALTELNCLQVRFTPSCICWFCHTSSSLKLLHSSVKHIRIIYLAESGVSGP